MKPHSILAVTDFSKEGHFAISRAAQLCAQHGAALKLMYLALPSGSPHDAGYRLEEHSRQLSKRHAISVAPFSCIAVNPEDVLLEARCVDLLVWGAAPRRGIQAFFKGQPVQRVLRKGKLPILVVRNPVDGPYRSVVVAVDFSLASPVLVEIGAALNRDAELELLHAVSTADEGKLRYAEVSSRTIRAYREGRGRRAQAQMLSFRDSLGGPPNRMLSAICYGNPVKEVVARQKSSGAELIVVGKHPASAVEDFLFESVAHGVLRESVSDVLVVPRGHQPKWKQGAASPLSPQPQVVRRIRAGTTARGCIDVNPAAG